MRGYQHLSRDERAQIEILLRGGGRKRAAALHVRTRLARTALSGRKVSPRPVRAVARANAGEGGQRGAVCARVVEHRAAGLPPRLRAVVLLGPPHLGQAPVGEAEVALVVVAAVVPADGDGRAVRDRRGEGRREALGRRGQLPLAGRIS